MAGTVLVTGASRYLGSRLIQLLQADERVDRVIAVDIVPPRLELGGAEFVRADIRSPAIAKLIGRSDVDTVVHMNVITSPSRAGARSTMKEINVIGTMQLLAACQQSASVRKLVVKSSSAVYGSSAADPALFSEDTEPRAVPRSGWAKDSVEVEGYVRGFGRRRPDVSVSVLRLANVIGPRVETSMTAYFSLPVLPSVLGYDARLQFLHEDDALAALRRATVEEHPGTFNVAGDGSLSLSQAARLAGRPLAPVPSPLVGLTGQVLRRARLADFSPEQVRYLSFGRCLDTTRMREVLGFSPRWTSRGAFEDFVRSRAVDGPLSRERVACVERFLQDLVTPGRPSDG
jgi:UDP-glucose 4-epimerase